MKRKGFLRQVCPWLLCAVLLTACGGQKAAESTADTTGADTAAKASTEAPAPKDTDTADKALEDSADSSMVSSEDTETADPVRAFLDGEKNITVKDSYYNGQNYTNGKFEKGKTYSYEELKGKFSYDETLQEAGDVSPTAAAYGKLDVSRAPGDWYCMELTFLDEGGQTPGSTYFILQALDDELYLCCSAESYYRQYGAVNKYGIASTGGSGGAGLHIDTYYAPDTEGDCQLIFNKSTNYYQYDFYEGENSDLPMNQVMNGMGAFISEEGGDISQFYGIQTQIDGKYYYTAVGETPEIQKKFEELAREQGAELTSEKEVEALVEKKIEQMAITTDMLTSTEAYSLDYQEDGFESSSVQEEGYDSSMDIDPANLDVNLYPDANSDDYQALSNIMEVPDAEPIPDANMTYRVVSNVENVAILLEQGAWVSAGESTPDYFHVDKTCFTLLPEVGQAYEFQVHETEGIPDQRLVFQYGTYETVYYCAMDGRGFDELPGYVEIKYEAPENAALTETDPIISLGKAYAGMLVSAGSTDALQSGDWYWRTLANAVTLVLTGSEHDTGNGILVPGWLLENYAMALGLNPPTNVDLSDNSPISPKGEDWMVEPTTIYEKDTVEVLDITSSEDQDYNVSFAVHGQIDEGVSMNFAASNSSHFPFKWMMYAAEIAKG
ncbi:MAG: hypothetical protein K5989_03325 [Lachnospiraceae bacterium]|nr:hypothetical protein [Lachnospiraceae bacterium]